MHLQDRRSTFKLTDSDGDLSTVEIEARYVPVPVKLLARESINSKQFVKSAVHRSNIFVTDQGMLRVDLLVGNDLHAADRTGKLYFVPGFAHANSFPRQIRPIRRLHSQWSEGIHISNQEENSRSCLVRKFRS